MHAPAGAGLIGLAVFAACRALAGLPSADAWTGPDASRLVGCCLPGQWRAGSSFLFPCFVLCALQLRSLQSKAHDVKPLNRQQALGHAGMAHVSGVSGACLLG